MSKAASVALSSEILPVTFLGTISFAVPFLLGGPQIVVGTIVNAALFLSVTFVPAQKRWMVIALPSLAVLARGVLFGQFTLFLAIIIPFIWISNFLLTYVFSLLKNRHGLLMSILGAASIKYLFLTSTVQLLFHLSLVPRMFLITFGIMQLFTAVLGGFLAAGLLLWQQKREKLK